MNNWLQNIKGQITELATEVLNDATEEGQVSASSELQVEKKKCAEAERQWLSEKAKNEAMDKRVNELEEQLFNSNVENDTIKEKFMGIVSDREQQIKRLNWEIERLRSCEEDEFKSINLSESPPPKVSVRAVGEELAELKEHNQRLVNENGQLHESLSQLNLLRDSLNSSNDELVNFRAKFAEMQDNFTTEIERITAERDGLRDQLDNLNSCKTQEKTNDCQCQTEEEQNKSMSTKEEIAELFEQNVQLKTALNEREEELRRLRSDKLLLADISSTDGHCKRPPSDTDSAASNNDWERMGKEEIEVEGVSSSAGSEAKEPTNRRKKSSELRDSSTQTDETQFDEEHLKEQLALLGEELARSNNKCQQMEKDLSGANLAIAESMKTKEFFLERTARLESDLQRLREHLLTVEEHSSKDAIAAEERETELRRQIRILQEKSTTEGTSLVNSLEQYQAQVSELSTNIAQLENDKSQLTTILMEREQRLSELDKSLSDLQNVLKELADDQKRDSQKTEAELWHIKEELKEKTHAFQEVEKAKINLEDQFASITHELNLSREQLLSKDNLVEELENQLEEMRIAGGKHHYVTSDQSSSIVGVRNGAASSHKIDDATLRQLFLSYFTAEKSKQPEIALVMTRILGYSAEEQSQINAALSKSSSSTSSWFAPFSANSSASPSLMGGVNSLTEQFVRFLEQESMANPRALVQPPIIHPLPSTADSGTFLVGESPPVPTHSSSSSADLKSMLEQ